MILTALSVVVCVVALLIRNKKRRINPMYNANFINDQEEGFLAAVFNK